MVEAAGGLGGIGQSLGGIVGGAIALGQKDKSAKTLKEAAAAWRQLQTSDFDYTSLDAPQLKLIAQYYPEVYNAVIPNKVKEIVESGEGEAAQQKALTKFEQMADQGLTAEEKVQRRDAAREIGSAASRSQQDVMRNLAARGQGGLSNELQARLLAGSGAQQAAAEAAMGQSSAEEQRKQQGAQLLASAGAQLRSQDLQKGVATANMMQNQNNLIAQMLTAQKQAAAEARERAQVRQQDLQQNLANQQEMLNYNTALENINRQNMLKGQLFSQQAQKAAGLTGALGNLAGAQQQQQQNKIQGIMNLSQGVGGLAGSAAGAAFGGF